MAAPTDSWDETLPADARNPALGDDDIRDFKRQVRERMVNGGHTWEVGGPSLDVDAGQHTCGVQGTTGVMDLAHEADGDVLIQCRDDTASADGGVADDTDLQLRWIHRQPA